MARTTAVILLAGIGSRLGKPHPKALTPLSYGETILARAIRILRGFGLPIVGVVGFKKDLIMEAAPDILFAYNPEYDQTNTSKSLLAGMRDLEGDVLWVNGDVVFDRSVVERLLAAGASAVAVDNARVAEEEVKYTVNRDGYIDAISKKVAHPLGEALGVNLVRGEHLDGFRRCLAAVAANDYFERAMELLIAERGNVFLPVNIGDGRCVEVDFTADLEKANSLFKKA